MQKMAGIISQTLLSTSIAPKAQPTKDKPINIEAWAAWLRIQTLNDPQLFNLVDLSARFVLRYMHDEKPSWLSILGTSGTGKTHCAKRIWDFMWDRFSWSDFEFITRPIYWPALIRDLRGGLRYGELTELSRWPVLMLDDIGAERDTTGFACEQLNTLLGCRVGKWTIITSNLHIEQLAAIDPRISDRIIREPGNQCVDLDCDSYALRSKDSTPINSSATIDHRTIPTPHPCNKNRS